jgi:phosphoribosylformylglycinamidine (FGAM) synthase-like enzyme
MQSWASEELRYVQLGDARLNRRLVKMVETFSEPRMQRTQGMQDVGSYQSQL